MSNCRFPVIVPQRQPLGHFQQKDHFWAFQTKPRVVAFPNFWLFFFLFVEIWRINVSLPWTRRSQFLKMFLFFHQNDRRLHILFILPLKHSFFQPRLRRATDFLHTKQLLVFLHIFFGRACGGLHIDVHPATLLIGFLRSQPLKMLHGHVIKNGS